MPPSPDSGGVLNIHGLLFTRTPWVRVCAFHPAPPPISLATLVVLVRLRAPDKHRQRLRPATPMLSLSEINKSNDTNVGEFCPPFIYKGVTGDGVGGKMDGPVGMTFWWSLLRRPGWLGSFYTNAQGGIG